MPPMVALSGPHPIAATINGSGARLNSSKEISAPETIEANISADAQPAAMAMRTIAIISCPAPFERLEHGQYVSEGFPDNCEILSTRCTIFRTRNAAVPNSIGNDCGPIGGPRCVGLLTDQSRAINGQSGGQRQA